MRATVFFPLLAIGAGGFAYHSPEMFLWAKPTIIPLLVLIMFGMGITLKPADFARVGYRPWVILLGVSTQFLVMPMAALGLSMALGLPDALLLGMVLVGATAGGTASNVITYLARGDVALSISMTLVSTCLAVFATPWLTWLYAGHKVNIDIGAMMQSIFTIVVLPVAGGVLVNRFLRSWVAPVQRFFPLLSMAAIIFIIAIIVALNQSNLAQLAMPLAIAVIAHNAIGLGAGYGMAALCRLDPVQRRTLAIEVGMQNSGLSVALATQYFSAMAALPGALFSIWHNISGSIIAAIWALCANSAARK